jgi:hypothetical protein
VLSSEELLRFFSESTKGKPLGGGGSALVRDLMRLADRNGDGTVARREWVRAYSAVKELLRDEEGVEL